MSAGYSAIEMPYEQIAEFCRRHHIGKLSLFGSVLRQDFNAASDIDILVEFEPGFVPGLQFFEMEAALSDLFGRRVDLNTLAFLRKDFRDTVLREARMVYVLPERAP